MKKNKMMRLASVMMVMTLMTTSVISGTFAKYVTSDEAVDTARVAKWGVTVTATDNSMFQSSYTGTDDKITVLTSEVSDKLVAPGTQGNTIGLFSLTGTPEVAVKIEVKIDDATKKDVFLKAGTYADMTTGAVDNFTFTGDDYYPVVFTLTNSADIELAKGNLSVIEKYFEETFSKDFVAPETNLAKLTGDTADGTYKLSWEWVFPTVEDVNIDKKDTLLGNLAANKTILAKGTGPDFVALTEGTDFCTELNFKLSVTVTQID